MIKMIFDIQRFVEISNSTANTIITGTSSNDNIKNFAENVTVNAMGGNDLLDNYADNVVLNGGDGDDDLWINGDGDDEVSINNVTINGGSGNDSITSYVGDYVFIDGGTGNDEIHYEGKYGTIKGGKGNDTINIWEKNSTSNTVQYADGDGDDVIVITPDVELPTIQITSGNVDSVDLSILHIGNGSIRLIGGNVGQLKLIDAQGNSIETIKRESVNEMSKKQDLFIIKGIYNEWLKQSLNLIEKSYGLTFGMRGYPAKIELSFSNKSNVNYIGLAKSKWDYYNDLNLEIEINLAKCTDIDTTDASGGLNQIEPLDVIMCHELTHSVMQANIDDFSYLPSYFVEGAADLTAGGDHNYSDIRYLLKSDVSTLKRLYNMGSISTSSSDYIYTYALGYMLLRYYAKETSEKKGISPTQTMTNLMLNLVDGYSYSEAINYASDGLFADEKILIDSFVSLVENASITTDEQADSFIKKVAGIDYSDYGEIDSGAITGSDAGGAVSKSYANVILENSSPSNWTMPNSNQYTYEDLTMIFPDGYITLISVAEDENSVQNNSDKVVIMGSNDDDTITNYGSKVSIYGGDGDDYIENHNSNVTIYGGAGDDKIYNDVYQSYCVYGYNSGDGSDTIQGFNTNDTIYLTNSIADTVYADKNNNVFVQVGDDGITLINTAGKEVAIKDSSGKTTRKSYSYVDKSTATPIPSPVGGYNYQGGDATISAGNSWNSSVNNSYEQINFATELNGFDVSGDNVYLHSNSGTLTVRNARGIYMKYAGSDGAASAYSYIGVSGSSSVRNYYTIDERNSYSYFGVIIGGDNRNESIIAGSGGSSLWGGEGGNDTLVGGDGYDEFIYNSGNGQDIILNAGSEDVVNLNGVLLDQFISVEVNESAVSATFADGGSLRVEGNTGVGYKLGDTIFAVNQSTNEWSAKS